VREIACSTSCAWLSDSQNRALGALIALSFAVLSTHRFGHRTFLALLSFTALLAVHSVAADSESSLARLLRGDDNKQHGKGHRGKEKEHGKGRRGKGHGERCRGRDCHGEDDFSWNGTGTGARTANPGLGTDAPITGGRGFDDNGTDSPISPTATPAGLPGLPVVPANNGTGAPTTGAGGTQSPTELGDWGVVAPPVPGGGLPVFPGGVSTVPPSSVDPAATDSPVNAPTAAPTTAPNAVSSVCLPYFVNRLAYLLSDHTATTVEIVC
jgi:hypothetical protein